eukprot:TRINITY_DN35606_c0_g1_i1.p1 TRINITY_DN35606_c0_g1~~TRINITY_DN35606_c0_g1_i1.p1  ORF type:complete len:350 (+),score=98.30 TRINITY_DN35606_c0_g1_i1:82-1050(+)
MAVRKRASRAATEDETPDVQGVEGKASSSSTAKPAAAATSSPSSLPEEPRDEDISVLPFGLSLPVLFGGMALMTAFCAAAKRLGYKDVGHGVFLVVFVSVFVGLLVHFVRELTNQTELIAAEVREKDREEEREKATSGAGESASANGSPLKLEMHGGNKAANGEAKNVQLTARRLTEVMDDLPDDEDDPVWDADWAAYVAQNVQAQALAEANAEAEVFEMNDTPTWLAHLEKRRSQAERAGKKKLAQKIEKEIAQQKLNSQQEASRSRSRRPSETDAGGIMMATTTTLNEEVNEDIYDADWSRLKSESTESPSDAAPQILSA